MLRRDCLKTVEELGELADGYVKLLVWFETHIEPPAHISVPSYISNLTLYSVMLSEASQSYKEQFIDERLFDPNKLTTAQGMFEFEYENTPERKRARERKAFFDAIRKEREQEKGEQ